MSRSEREQLLSIAETVREIALALSEDVNVEPGRRRALAGVVVSLEQSIVKLGAE
jgi:hypothetical protein